jgi:membrane-bound metal-dependent hydrolase YbcI (DUF457 family)
MTHRGITHSILAMVLFHNLLVILLTKMGIQPKESAFLGVIFCVGYLTHLILDELYSVDFQGKRLKVSFGTALKLTTLSSRRDIVNTAVFLLLVVVSSTNMLNPPIAKMYLSGDLTYLDSQRATGFLRFYDGLLYPKFWDKAYSNFLPK